MDNDAPKLAANHVANDAPTAEQDYERVLRHRAASLLLAAVCLLLLLTWLLSLWKSPDLTIRGPVGIGALAGGTLVFAGLALRSLYANVWTEFEDPEFRARNLRFYGLRLAALGLAFLPCLIWGLPTMLHHLGRQDERALTAVILGAGEDESRGGCGRFLDLSVDLEGRRRSWRACQVADEVWDRARPGGAVHVRGRLSAHGFDVEEVEP